MSVTEKYIQDLPALGKVLVTGGTGFLGHHIVKLLADRNAGQIHVLDIREPASPISGVQYHNGDITDYDAMLKLLGSIRPDAVVHTASPNHFSKNHDLFYRINVEGTKTLVRACQDAGSVKAFVHTSSASVISDTRSDLVYADETYPLVMGKEQPEYYTTTKAQAELHVLASNRAPSSPHLLTCAIRPSAMFGEGDVQLLPPGLSAYYRGQTKFQIGANENLFDFTEITNVAHAHHLALAALLTTAKRDSQGQAKPLDHEKVDGEAFLITNDSPVYFFDFARRCWAEAGDKTQPDQVWALSKDLGLLIATIMELIFKIFGMGNPMLTRQRVQYTCMTRYFNIEKAKTRLGYAPVVSMDEGVRRGVKDALYRGVVEGQPQELKGKR